MKRTSDYQGWANYETWAVALWLNNDSGSHGYWTERAIEYMDDYLEEGSDPNVWSDAAIQLGDEIRSDLEEGNPVTEASLYSDLLNSAIGEVDFREVAESFLEIAKESLAYKFPGE